MKSKSVLPILAAAFILLMLVAPLVTVAKATAVTPVYPNPALTVFSIPEDDQVRNKGIMWFDPSAISVWADPLRDTSGVLSAAEYMRTDPMWGATSAQIVASESLAYEAGGSLAMLDPMRQFGATDIILWYDKMAQFKLKVELEGGLPGQNGYTGVPLITLVKAGQAVFYCEVYEKDKVEPKIPQDWTALLSSLAYNSLSEEYLKTVLTDISSFFVCKLRDSGQAGVYVVDLYYIGPQTSEYVAENIVAFKVELLPAVTGLAKPVWGLDIQDLCILAWPFSDPWRGGLLIPIALTYAPDWQKFPELIPKPEHRWIWSVPDPLAGYSNCEEATLFQRHLMGATIPIAPNN